jgi:hypothetical protein
MVIEYLNKYTHPVEAKDVLAEVKKYRPTISEKSLLANLYRDPRFDILPGKFISFEAYLLKY